MFKGEFEFNLYDMRSSDRYSKPEYIQAYPRTNEAIESWLQISPIHGKRVLSVAASGDQPLFYAANGAATVDTFDKVINSCVVMDFKTTALKMHLKYEDYMYLINNLHDLSYPYWDRDSNLSTKTFDHVVTNMPERTRQIMQSFTHPKPGMTINTCCYKVKRAAKFPSPELYKRCQKILLPHDRQFNFIWADLMNVHNYIKGKYDIIYLSNIFDHYGHYIDKSNDYKSIWKSLKSLWPYLSVGGYMLFTTLHNLQPAQKYRSIYNIFKFSECVLKVLHTNANIKCSTRDANWATIIIHKTR